MLDNMKVNIHIVTYLTYLNSNHYLFKKQIQTLKVNPMISFLNIR